MTQKLDALEVSVSAVGNGAYVATETDKITLGRSTAEATPLRIDVYDIGKQTKLLTVKLNSDSPYYDLSPQGELAVVEGDELRVYSGKK